MDPRHRPLEFQGGDQVFLRVSPTKGVTRFGKVEKLSSRYVGLYPVIQQIGEVAYRLGLPTGLQRIHNVFHMSQLWKYISDPLHIIEPELIQLQDDLSYEEQPI